MVNPNWNSQQGDGVDAWKRERELRVPESKTSVAYRQAHLPYGVWICADGRQVIFNRDYKPLCQRSPEGVVMRADPEEQVPFLLQAWFYSDGVEEAKKRQRGVEVLAAWGLEPPPGPRGGQRQ